LLLLLLQLLRVLLVELFVLLCRVYCGRVSKAGCAVGVVVVDGVVVWWLLASVSSEGPELEQFAGDVGEG
jgi:hypothetical protein